MKSRLWGVVVLASCGGAPSRTSVFDPSGNRLRGLRGKNAKVREVRFDGGHLLDEGALVDALSAP